VRSLVSCSPSKRRFRGSENGPFFPRTAMENPVFCLDFVLLSWQTPHARGRMHRRGQMRRPSKVVKVTDLYWDRTPEARPPVQVPAWHCQPHGTLSVFWHEEGRGGICSYVFL
jgi:hypothetical protein